MTRSNNVKCELNGNPKKSYALFANDDDDYETSYTCDLCGKSFTRKSSLTIHVNSHYLKEKQEGDRSRRESQKNTCNICNKNFTAKRNLLKHLRRVHKNYKEADKMRIKKIKCPEKECEYVCRLMKELREHIQRFHKIKIFRDVLEFHNHEEFQKWKKDEENDAVAMFVTGRMKTSLINGCKRQTLHCHRTGQYSPKGFGKYRMRSIGSCKIGVTCPAAIEMTESPSGQINVVYYKTHLGHEHDVAHLKLTRDERAELAEKIEQGFSLDAILEDVREYNELQRTKTKRMDLLSKKDLYSIMRTVNNNIIKKLRKKEEERKKQEEAQSQAQSRSQSRTRSRAQPQPQPQPQPQTQSPSQSQSQPELESQPQSLPLPKETEMYQEGPILIGTVENQENFNGSFPQNFPFYPTPSVVVPQDTVYLEPQPNFVTYQQVESNPVPVSVPVGVPQVSGEGVASQVVILSPEMNYGPVTEIVLLPPDQGPPPPPPTLTVYPQNPVMQEPQVVVNPEQQPLPQPQPPPSPPPPLPMQAPLPGPMQQPLQQPLQQPPPPPLPLEPLSLPIPQPVPVEEMTLEEKNKLNRPNLRLQIQEKIDKIVELLPDSDLLTPKQFALINAKLNRVLDIYNVVSAKAKLRKQPMKKRILKKVQYDGDWRNNADRLEEESEPRMNGMNGINGMSEMSEMNGMNGNVFYGRETVLQQPVYETPVLYAVYN